MWYIICLIIGAILGFTCAALCHAAKEADEQAERLFKKPLRVLERENFEHTLKVIINGDISLYKKLYQKTNNTYYLGRIKECEFLLGIVEGKRRNEKC